MGFSGLESGVLTINQREDSMERLRTGFMLYLPVLCSAAPSLPGAVPLDGACVRHRLMPRRCSGVRYRLSCPSVSYGTSSRCQLVIE